jgi:hypothetical protein
MDSLLTDENKVCKVKGLFNWLAMHCYCVKEKRKPSMVRQFGRIVVPCVVDVEKTPNNEMKRTN